MIMMILNNKTATTRVSECKIRRIPHRKNTNVLSTDPIPFVLSSMLGLSALGTMYTVRNGNKSRPLLHSVKTNTYEHIANFGHYRHRLLVF